MKQSILGIYPDRVKADMAFTQLQNNSFSPSSVSVITRSETQQVEEQSKVGQAIGEAASGATAGAVIAGIAGLLVGIGAITVPGVGALLIGGPIAVALGLTGAAATTVSAAATGALAGGLLGGFVGIGLPEAEAKIYVQKVQEGGVVLAVMTNSDDELNKAREILTQSGADQIQVV